MGAAEGNVVIEHLGFTSQFLRITALYVMLSLGEIELFRA